MKRGDPEIRADVPMLATLAPHQPPEEGKQVAEAPNVIPLERR